MAGAEVVELDEGIGTASRPFLGPTPVGDLATSLLSVEPRTVAGTPGFLVRGEGGFSYSCFLLPEPDRFVVDLAGVMNDSAVDTVTVGGDIVRQVRVGQFQTLPEPVTRVVFDLSARGRARIQQTDEGLLLIFESP